MGSLSTLVTHMVRIVDVKETDARS